MLKLSPRALFVLAASALLWACDPKTEPTPTPTPTADAGAAPAADAGAQKPSEPPADAGKAAPPAQKAALKKGLMVALSQFKDGNPGPARLEILTHDGSAWITTPIEDPDSNVFHKALAWPPADPKGIITLGGAKANVKLWTKDAASSFKSEVLWTKDFGGKTSRMRDAEIGDVFGDGNPTLAVATHDQGVVATLRPSAAGAWEVKEWDAKPNIFVHEIELGDVDGDKILEIYATPSEPNNFDVEAQKGVVTRYIPAKGADAKAVVADLGDRHAKEILVGDVDGNGTDELYVSLEAKTVKDGDTTKIEAPVEIRRYEKDTDPTKGAVIAKLDDRFCRFLTAGDVDGDGKKEMIAAPFKSGVWLLKPGADVNAEWTKTQVEKESSGFEHAAALLDLDEDGKAELYVASDEHGELRRYTWNGTGFDREVILKRENPKGFLTWNLSAVPAALVK